MSDLNKLLDKIKETRCIASNNALAAAMGVSRKRVNGSTGKHKSGSAWGEGRGSKINAAEPETINRMDTQQSVKRQRARGAQGHDPG